MPPNADMAADFPREDAHRAGLSSRCRSVEPSAPRTADRPLVIPYELRSYEEIRSLFLKVDHKSDINRAQTTEASPRSREGARDAVRGRFSSRKR